MVVPLSDFQKPRHVDHSAIKMRRDDRPRQGGGGQPLLRLDAERRQPAEQALQVRLQAEHAIARGAHRLEAGHAVAHGEVVDGEARLGPWRELAKQFRDEGFYERFAAKGEVERVTRIHRELARAAGIEVSRKA